ncbi:hypothetical protein [Arthrobacter sp. MAHUQ-56]
MRMPLNMTAHAITTLRFLAYVAGGGGALGFILNPTESLSALALALTMFGLLGAAAIALFFLCRPYMAGRFPSVGRPNRLQARMLWFGLLIALLPFSLGWSSAFFLLVGTGLILAGLTALASYAFGPEDELTAPA